MWRLDGSDAQARARILYPRSRALPLLIGSFAVMLGLAAATSPTAGRAVIATCVAVFMAVICLRQPRAALIALLMWLAALGTLRRLLLGAGASGDNDPLLLVAPVAVVVLVAVAARRGALRNRTNLTGSVLVLSGLVLASTVNPLQGNLSVGIAALLFILVPLLWFWLGRWFVTDALLMRALSIATFLAIASAGYGLFQVYVGFPAWDANWIQSRGYAALAVGDLTRPFASFSNASEYVTFLAIGSIVLGLRVRQNRQRVAALAALIFIAWALAVASVRSVTVILLVTLAFMIAASKGLGAVRCAVVGFIALFVFGVAISTIDPGSVGGDRTSALLSRQVTGLADPFNSDQRVSTLPLHLRLIGDGLRSALHNPLGRGFGSVTIAGDRFGSETVSTEADPSNIAVALGLPGVFAYGFVVFLGIRLAFRRARHDRSFLALAALGILLVTSLQWLNGGNYSTALFPWLILGWLDRPADHPEIDIPALAPVSGQISDQISGQSCPEVSDPA